MEEASQPPSSSPPSSPLSMLSQSPSLSPAPLVLDPSKRYPSPISSSAPSGSASPMKMPDGPDIPGEIQVRTDGPPPPKRRRIAARPRTTEYIDLENQADLLEDENLTRLMTALRKRKRIVVFAGAGISVSAGIPDFRSSKGLFKDKDSGKELFDAAVYKHDSSTAAFHKMVCNLAQMASNAKPTPFHHLVASLAQEGRLLRLYTQNIDCLDTQMPPLATNVPLNIKGPWPMTIQLHGGLEKMVCTKCAQVEPFDVSLFQGAQEAPLCQTCKEQDEVRTAFAGKRSHGIGRLRPRIVLYNEYNPDEEAIGNVSKADLKRIPDAVIVVGTTLKIPGARRLVKEMCQLTRSRRDGITAWINLEGEPQGAEFKDCWDLVVRGKCDDIAERVNLPRWDQQDLGESDTYKVTGNQQEEERCLARLTRDIIEVPLESKRRSTPGAESSSSSQGEVQTPANRKSKLVGQLQGGMPTPSASPRVRSPVPNSKPATKGKARQATLQFGKGILTQPKADAPAAARTKLPATRGRPRKNKTEPAKPMNTINQTFRATKAVASSAKDLAKESAAPDADSLTLPSLPSLAKKDLSAALPSLRPTNELPDPAKRKRDSGSSELTFFTSSPPTTPVSDNTTISTTKNITISPGSKPRSMSHLID